MFKYILISFLPSHTSVSLQTTQHQHCLFGPPTGRSSLLLLLLLLFLLLFPSKQLPLLTSSSPLSNPSSDNKQAATITKLGVELTLLLELCCTTSQRTPSHRSPPLFGRSQIWGNTTNSRNGGGGGGGLQHHPHESCHLSCHPPAALDN